METRALQKTRNWLLACAAVAIIVWSLAITAPAKGPQKGPADLVIFGANIVTLHAKQPKASAIAIVGDRIAAMGNDASIRPWIGPKTKQIQAKGRMVLPGLIEGHGHLLGLGKLTSQLNLVGTKSEAQIIGMVQKQLAKRQIGEWVLGRGWDQNDWQRKQFPHHKALSLASPGNPVYLRRIDGHAAWVNRKALQLAGINKRTRAPKGGQIIRDAKGEPTGVLIDNAMSLVSRLIPKTSTKQNTRAILSAIKTSLKHGITSFHDAGVTGKTIAIYKSLLKARKLDMRLYVMIAGGDEQLLQRWLKRGPEIGLGHHYLTIRSIKLLADGALGSRGAVMQEPYADKHNHKGLAIIGKKKLTSYAKRALQHGFQLAVHAIGDQANRVTLDAFAQAMKIMPWRKDPRFRVEHAQILSATDIPRFAKLGVIASMQPTHCTSDMPWVHKRIGKRRAKQGAYVWQSLLKTGAKIAAGSDTPVESVNPFWGLYAAITRQDHKGQPKGGWYPAQRMTRMQALKAFTIDAAYAAFEETQKGSLAVGKLADLILIDRDYFKSTPKQLLKTRVLLTVVGGKIRHQTKATQ